MKAQKVRSSGGMCFPVMLVGAVSVSAVMTPLLSSCRQQQQKGKAKRNENKGNGEDQVQHKGTKLLINLFSGQCGLNQAHQLGCEHSHS